MRKFSAKIVVLLILSLLLTACGAANEGVAMDAAQTAEAVEEETQAVTKEEPVTEEETIANENGIALSAYEDEADALSIEFVFDKDKLRVSDEDSCGRSHVTLESITDPGSILEMTCDLTTVQEIYDKVMDGYMGDEWILSEMTESTVAGMPIYYFDVKHMSIDSVNDCFFVLDAGNGLCLHNRDYNGYEGNESLETMISYAFLEVKQGDGTIYRPQLPFTVESDGNVLTVEFASGESYTLDYAEDVVDVSPTGASEIYVGFIEEELNMQMNLSLYVSNKYSSMVAYDLGEEIAEYWESGLPIKQVNINGVDIEYITNEDRQKAIFLIPMADGYSIRGEYYCWSETGKMTYTLENALAMLLGGEVELASSASGTVDYGYQTPDSLGSKVEDLNFNLDGYNYHFPVPAYAFIQNGWEIPNIYTNFTPEIPAGEMVDAAFEIGTGEFDGSIIYSVVLSNPTDAPIALEDGLVVDMIIARDSNVELELAEAINFNSDMGQVAGTTEYEGTQNGDYTSYLWFREEDGANISVFFGSDGMIEYFRFMGY